ncbi:MAG TPA: 16S rRNA (adenine(1518)-N(6)/adenine(1519)-N(6))-dimethyltransferase RsmA [Candidatus Peribacteraceae bacterium]|nr:16S rRNA (adenine(1518)-N(6)/adenine(1519)-N(6))-dimethyltransferase RsmA [Candidatus Peribacteraceae bacterium]
MKDLASHVRQFCKEHGLIMNTDLGQHFLIDQSVLDAILETANVKEDDDVVEIGAGIGILTLELLKRTKNVTTIEIDPNVIPLLQEYLKEGESPHLPTVVRGNALQASFPQKPYKIVANIPYHITSPLLRHAFLESSRAPLSLTLLIQREVAEKIVDTKNAGLLTVIVGFFGTPRIVTKVPPKAFLPPPKVDSAVLHIDCFAEPKADAQTFDALLSLAKLSFGQKRKMLRNTFASLPGGLEMLDKAGIEGTRRPQTLSIDEWITLATLRV